MLHQNQSTSTQAQSVSGKERKRKKKEKKYLKFFLSNDPCSYEYEWLTFQRLSKRSASVTDVSFTLKSLNTCHLPMSSSKASVGPLAWCFARDERTAGRDASFSGLKFLDGTVNFQSN
jgi:hypothetical protein